jgi:hypothetical protein
MRDRIASFFGALVAVILTLTSVGSVGVAIQDRNGTAAPAAWTPPRTPWGDPDLQGIWTNINEAGTPFERPGTLAGIDATDPDALAKQHAADRASREERARFLCDIGGVMPTGAGPVHWYESLDPEKSRLWSVTDPPDGKIPPLTAEAAKRAAEREEYRRAIPPGKTDEVRPGGWLDDLDGFVRCITRGLPGMWLPGAYNANHQFLQGPGYVTILYEMFHETRVIPLNGRPHIPGKVRQWLGDSRGRWEGNALVIDTTNFVHLPPNGGLQHFRGATGNLRLIERLTRTGPNTIDWSVTLEDPSTWTRPWTFAMPLTKDDKQEWIFEYACHEGNYSLRNMLSGFRAQEQAKTVGRRGRPER